jgi:lipoprotein-anchoring transpeptidase ErfK/SrfK
MIESLLSRREVLKYLAYGVGGILLSGYEAPFAMGRVAAALIYVYDWPSFNAKRTGRRTRDQILYLFEAVDSPQGPPANPRWYRILDGYVHSANIQKVEMRMSNMPLSAIPSGGMLGEISPPFTRSMRWTRADGWQPLYKLYYESIHRIIGVDEGPDRRPWYRLFDDLMRAEYHVAAADVRPIPPQEYAPLGQDIPAEEQRIVVSLKDQTLTAYAGEQVVLRTQVSSGVHTQHLKKDELPTDTPKGYYHIQLKMPARHMGDGKLTADPNAYELPGVPWAMVFQKDGIALHGTYWHDNFGSPMSHGCVNLRSADALWLFRWTRPVYYPSEYYVQGLGTAVQVV